MGDIRVDRDNRVIYGVSLISKGVAKGHDVYVDSVFVQQVVDAANAMPRGVKCRAKHPGLCDDGYGSLVGFIRDVRFEDNKAVGNLYILPVADESPSGSHGNYVMSLAEQAPSAFGLSIVFDSDPDSYVIPDRNKPIDEDNVEGLPHVRLRSLEACDLVDTPAANPSGLFSSVADLQQRATAVMAYVVGVTNKPPVEELGLGLHPKGVKRWFNNFLNEHNLYIASKQDAVKDTTVNENTENTVIDVESADYKAGYSAGYEAGYAAAMQEKSDEDQMILADSEEEEEEEPATVEMLSKLPGVDDSFIVEQLRKRATLLSAQTELLKRLAQKLSVATKVGAGVKPVTTGYTSEPISKTNFDFFLNQYRRQLSEKGLTNKDEIEYQAVKMLMLEEPAAYRAYCASQRRRK